MSFGYGEQDYDIDKLGFKDVDYNSWYIKYIAIASENGFIKGYNNETEFRPSDKINRVEALTMLFAIAKIQINSSTYSSTSFTDVHSNSWFEKYVSYAEINSIVSGKKDGVFAPSDNITRAESIKIIDLLVNKN